MSWDGQQRWIRAQIAELGGLSSLPAHKLGHVKRVRYATDCLEAATSPQLSDRGVSLVCLSVSWVTESLWEADRPCLQHFWNADEQGHCKWLSVPMEWCDA